jgi:choline dehydrogenase-like flavoprotein
MEIMIAVGYIVIGGGTAGCALAAPLPRPGRPGQ